MNELLQETKETYYTYITNVSNGAQMIANELRQGQEAEAFIKIINFAEGMEWLVKIEEIFSSNGFKINSRITEANEFLTQINDALINKDFVLVADLFEYEIASIFSSASEWIFSKGDELKDEHQ